jgi:hypothetical protein
VIIAFKLLQLDQGSSVLFLHGLISLRETELGSRRTAAAKGQTQYPEDSPHTLIYSFINE